MNKKDEMWSLLEFSAIDESTITIDDRKKVSQFMKESRKDAKKDTCFHCKKEVTSFCNSHSVPAFTLKNIAKEGKLLTLNQFVEMPFIDKISGLQSTGTFRIICRDCDSKIFADYENPENYRSDPTQKMLSQMALKNYLLAISKKFVETSMYNKSLNMTDANEYLKEMLVTQDLDLTEYIDGYNLAKRNLEKNWNEYYLIYYKMLPYVTPIAFQDKITLHVDLDNRIVNDIYNYDPKYHTKELHLCVLPLENSTVITMFIHNNDRSRYRSFYKAFRKKSENEKLEIINYIILSYSENFYISPYLSLDVINDEKLIQTALLSSNAVIGTNDSENVNPMKLLNEKYTFNNVSNVPNLLSEDNKIVKV